MLGYTDRRHQLGEHLKSYGSQVASNGMLAPTILIDGGVVGTWKRTLKARSISIRVKQFRQLTAAEKRGVFKAAERYGQFLGRESVVEFANG